MAMLAAAFVLGAGSTSLVKAGRRMLQQQQPASKLNSVTGSGLHIAGIRAACQRFCDIVPDPLAEVFVGREAVDDLVMSYAKLSMLVVLGRPRWIDTRIEAAMASGIRQVVILGAGMDARAYYLGSLRSAAVFEVDLPEVIEYKESTLAKNRRKVPPLVASRLERVAANLENPDWTKSLVESGFLPHEPAIWVLEGLIFFLAEAAASTLMTTVRSLSTSDSIVCFDVPNKAFCYEDHGKTATRVELEKLRTSFKFTTDNPETWLGDMGFQDVLVNQLGEPGIRPNVVDWDPDNPFGIFISMSHKLPRDVGTDSYGRPVHRFFWVEAKSGPSPQS